MVLQTQYTTSIPIYGIYICVWFEAPSKQHSFTPLFNFFLYADLPDQYIEVGCRAGQGTGPLML